MSERPTRAQLAREVETLRGLGFLQREIADALGISRSYASELCIDPTGEAARARKDTYKDACVDCGAETSGSEGRRVEPRCVRCAAVKSALTDRTKWTAAIIIARIQEWADLYGEPPSGTDWNPWSARNVLHDEDRARRFEDGLGHWPWFTLVVNRFGSFSAAIEAAGFAPRDPFWTPENYKRSRRFRAKATA